MTPDRRTAFRRRTAADSEDKAVQRRPVDLTYEEGSAVITAKGRWPRRSTGHVGWECGEAYPTETEVAI